LSDLAFQRHILVQALILLDFLLSLSEKSKKRLSHLNTQKALQYPFTLSEADVSFTICTFHLNELTYAQVEWATKVRVAIADYLQDGPEGKFYYRMVDTVLSRDKNWVRWKMESCPPIAKSPVTGEAYEQASVQARAACTSKRIRATPMGALDLSFLSQSTLPTTSQHVDGSSRYVLAVCATLRYNPPEVM
jgi:THO complex subunit 1